MSYAVGIDVGIAESHVAVIKEGKQFVIPTPGSRGINYSKYGLDYKSDLTRDLSVILKELKQNAEKHIGDKVDFAVITVPSRFDAIQRQVVKDAAKIAGIDAIRLISKATAAALSYGFNNAVKEGRGENVLVCSLDSEHFDVSILEISELEISEGIFEVLSTSGDTHLGSRDVDVAVIDWLVQSVKEKGGVDFENDVKTMQLIQDEVEKAKIKLLSSVSTTIILPFIAVSGGEPKHLEVTLTRAKLKELAEPTLKRLEPHIMCALEDAKVLPSDIDKIILSGGPTRMPIVRERFERILGKKAEGGVDLMQSVAMGAAVQAGVLTGQVKEILLLDATPLALSVETLGGVATKLIERNTTIPTKKGEPFTTVRDNQTSVEIHITQGGKPMSADNSSLGKFQLDDISPAPRGIPQIEVTFDIEPDGILNVTAKDLESGKEEKITTPLPGSYEAKVTEGKEIMRIEVVPRTLSIETLGGVATTLIERNTNIPTKKGAIFTTVRDNQTSVEIHITQGEKPMSADNSSLGKFQLDDISPAPRGIPQIEVTFDVNTDGILNVTAKDLESGKEEKITNPLPGSYEAKVTEGKEIMPFEVEEEPSRPKSFEHPDFFSSIEFEIMELKSTGVKIPESSKNLIEEAKSELNKNNFERAKKLLDEVEKIVREIKAGYDLAFRSINEAERILNESKTKGMIISSDLLTKSKQAFDNGDYEESIKFVVELKNLLNNEETKYRDAQEGINSAESMVKRAKEFGSDVLGAEERLKSAERLFDKKAYDKVIETSKQIEELLNKIREVAKPEITLKLSETSFRPNVGKRMTLNVKNEGNANAKDVKIAFSGEVEVKGLKTISLKSNEIGPLEVGIIPKCEGEVLLDCEITYKDFDNNEYKEGQTFWITVGERMEEGEKEKQQVAVEIKRGYEVLQNNDLRFGIRVINNTGYAVMDAETILDYPRTLFSLKDNVVQTLANIHPNGERTAKYILTPLGCIHNEKIDATVFYKDHSGKKQTVHMHPKEVHCVCPFLREKAMREGEFAELADACEPIEDGLSFSGISINEIAAFVKEACVHRLYVIVEHEIDAAKIVYLAGESIGEKAYYLLTAVIRPYKNLTQVALRAYSDKPYGLHGFLNEIVNSIRHLVLSVQSAEEIGIIENKQVINIIDSVMQRTSIGGVGEGTGTGATSVNIEGSVVQRSEIGSIRKCPSCGKEVQGDVKFCTACGARLG